MPNRGLSSATRHDLLSSRHICDPIMDWREQGELAELTKKRPVLCDTIRAEDFQDTLELNGGGTMIASVELDQRVEK